MFHKEKRRISFWIEEKNCFDYLPFYIYFFFHTAEKKQIKTILLPNLLAGRSKDEGDVRIHVS